MALTSRLRKRGFVHQLRPAALHELREGGVARLFHSLLIGSELDDGDICAGALSRSSATRLVVEVMTSGCSSRNFWTAFSTASTSFVSYSISWMNPAIVCSVSALASGLGMDTAKTTSDLALWAKETSASAVPGPRRGLVARLATFERGRTSMDKGTTQANATTASSGCYRQETYPVIRRRSSTKTSVPTSSSSSAPSDSNDGAGRRRRRSCPSCSTKGPWSPPPGPNLGATSAARSHFGPAFAFFPVHFDGSCQHTRFPSREAALRPRWPPGGGRSRRRR